MKEITLTFTCEDIDTENEAKRAIGADDVWRALSEIRETLFRPSRKHGYPGGPIQEAYDACEALQVGSGSALISALEDEFGSILSECGVDESFGGTMAPTRFGGGGVGNLGKFLDWLCVWSLSLGALAVMCVIWYITGDFYPLLVFAGVFTLLLAATVVLKRLNSR